MDLLNVTSEPFSDNSVEDYQFHTYQPYIPGNLNYNDEIRIPIQDLDTFTAPCNSYLYIEGKLMKSDGTVATKLQFINNGIAFLFRELRYELNGIVVDSVRNVGLVSTIKNYLSYNENESVLLQNAGWFPNKSANQKILVDASGNFNVCIPLKLLMGFFEDFRKVIINMKQELVLIRSSNDNDAITSLDDTEIPKIDIQKLYWKVPHVTVSIQEQLRLNKTINKNVELPIKFRSWELIEYPSLSSTTRHTWPVKTTTKVETPRHVIVAFQNDRKNRITTDMSKFDHCDLKNIRIFLNSERYPYNDLFIDFENNKYATLFEMYANFQESYYSNKTNQPIFNPTDFKLHAPLAHIDCSRQKETLQTGSIVMRIEFETERPTSANTTAYCLILHERHFTYNPLTKIVKQY
ncbi:hypothetical protein NQ317_001520 [Molorchus minor]|uniref:Double jelly roll-like domain-containing protein n=1 Tax=Molorchus minor TaxID=1323400 RepID=A0ABQ9J2U5_9CUCU|nr:hypothetical protein NQ317_001520 [Molorchus minor]